jgi:hypothetical protein
LNQLLKSLTRTSARFAKNIIFCPSSAGVSICKHFGRFYPIHMFTSLHDFAAEPDSQLEPFHPVCEINAAHAITPFILANHLCLLSDRDIADAPVRVPTREDFRVFDEDLEK